MKRFLKNLFTHPGTWVLASLIAVGIGMAAPAIAAAAIIFAAVGMGLAAIALFPYIRNGLRLNRYNMKHENHMLALGDWAKAHPAQAIVVGLGVAGFIAALVLTIGFFSGGFVFMAPVFAAISAPFALFAASAGISLSLPALAGFCFVMAPLTLANNLKRLLGWGDSYKYDYVQYQKQLTVPLLLEDKVSLESLKYYRDKANTEIEKHGYLKVIKSGAIAVMTKGSLYENARENAQQEKISLKI